MPPEGERRVHGQTAAMMWQSHSEQRRSTASPITAKRDVTLAVDHIYNSRKRRRNRGSSLLSWQHPSTMFISHRALPLIVVVLVVLAGAPLFASWEAPGQPLQAPNSTAFGPISGNSESSIPSWTSMLAASENYGVDTLLLSNYSDTENEDDQNPDSPEVLGMVSSLILLLLGGKLLLARYEEADKLSSICCLALKRPG